MSVDGRERREALRKRFGIAMLWAVAAVLSIGVAAADGVLQGKVLSDAGDPLSGVTVSAAAAGSSLTVSVYTDGEGNYIFPSLPEGDYRVWAQALGFDIDTASVDVTTASQQDFTLHPLTDFETLIRQLPGDVLMEALPSETAQDRRMRDAFGDDCTSCHTPSYTLQHRFTQAGWDAIVTMMERISITGSYEDYRFDGEPLAPDPGISFNRTALVPYLARARGPNSQNELNVVLPERPSGDAANVVWRAYHLPIDPLVEAGLPVNYSRIDGQDWTAGSPYGIGQPGVQPLDAVHDASGNIWFTITSPNKVGTLGRIDTASGEISYLRRSQTEGDLAAVSHGIARSGDGLIWFDVLVDNGSLAAIDPETLLIRVYPTDLGRTRFTLPSVSVGPDDTVWVNVGGGALHLNPQTFSYTFFPAVTTETLERRASLSYGMTVDAEGNGWWVMFGLDLAQRGHIQSLNTTEIALPDVPAGLASRTPVEESYYANLGHFGLFFYPWSVGARQISADPNGRLVWVANSSDESLTRIDIDTNEATLVPIPGMFRPFDVKVASNGDVWMSSNGADHLLRYRPETETWTRFDLPERGTEVRRFSIFEEPDGLRIAAVGYRTRTVYEMWLPGEP